LVLFLSLVDVLIALVVIAYRVQAVAGSIPTVTTNLRNSVKLCKYKNQLLEDESIAVSRNVVYIRYIRDKWQHKARLCYNYRILDESSTYMTEGKR